MVDFDADMVSRLMLFRLGKALASERLMDVDNAFSRFLALMMGPASLQFVKLTAEGHGTYSLGVYMDWFSGSYEEVRSNVATVEEELEVLGFTKKAQEEGMDEFEFVMEVPHQYSRLLLQCTMLDPAEYAGVKESGLLKDAECDRSDVANVGDLGKESSSLPGDAHAQEFVAGQDSQHSEVTQSQEEGLTSPQQSQREQPRQQQEQGDHGLQEQQRQQQEQEQQRQQPPQEQEEGEGNGQQQHHHQPQQQQEQQHQQQRRQQQQQQQQQDHRQDTQEQQRRSVEPASQSQRHREEELLQDGPLFGTMAMGSQLGSQLPIQRLVPITMQADFVGFDEPMLQGPIRGWGVEQVAHWLAIQPYFREYGNDVREKFLKEQINGLALLSLDDHQLSQMGFSVGLRNNLRHFIEQARSRDAVVRAHQPSSPPRGSGLIPPFPMTMSSLNTVPPPVSSPPTQQSVGSALSLIVDGSGDAGSYLGKRSSSSSIPQEKKMHAYVELDVETINQQSAFTILEPIVPPEGMRLSVTRKTSRKGGIAREKLTGILGQVVLLQRKSGDLLDDISNVEGDLLVPGSHSLGIVKFRKWEVVNHCVRVVLRHVTVPCKEEHETLLHAGDGPPKKKRARRETQTACLIFTITTNGGKHTVVLPLLMHHNNTTSVGPSTLHVQPGCVTINTATKEVVPPKVLIRGFHLNNSVLSWTAVPANPNLPTVTLPILDVIQIKKTGVTGRESRLVEEAVEFDMPWEEQLPVGVSKESLIVDGKPHMDHLTWTLVVDATPLASVATTQLSATYRLLPKPDETEVKWDPHSCWNRHLDVMFQ